MLPALELSVFTIEDFSLKVLPIRKNWPKETPTGETKSISTTHAKLLGPANKSPSALKHRSWKYRMVNSKAILVPNPKEARLLSRDTVKKRKDQNRENMSK
jgi:hypothetical protein